MEKKCAKAIPSRVHHDRTKQNNVNAHTFIIDDVWTSKVNRFSVRHSTSGS